MSQGAIQDLPPVARSLLLPLCFRAAEARRSDALIHDAKAVEVVQRLGWDCGPLLKHESHDQVTVLMRAREFDRCVREFLAAHPRGVVVDMGCGLDTRFYRVDNGLVTWYDLDLPEVIALRRKVLDESSRHSFIGCSVVDFAWLNTVQPEPGRAYLFLAEGVFMFLEGGQVRCLLQALAEHYPGSEIVFDAFTPLMLHRSTLLHPAARQTLALLRWGLADNREPETWAESIQLLSEWYYFDQPEPRLGVMRLLRWVPGIARGAKILRYRLGEVTPYALHDVEGVIEPTVVL
ncbi:MAG: class I SAM-dependent methyltransferase [Anaerolineae bacterium]|nr:class I SAM-dependent methyltransferase [Anaerolineae bacterium]